VERGFRKGGATSLITRYGGGKKAKKMLGLHFQEKFKGKGKMDHQTRGFGELDAMRALSGLKEGRAVARYVYAQFQYDGRSGYS